MNTFLWGMLPYACVTLLVGGTIWRYKYDQFGWTTRSSQLYESKLLKIASPLFHFGLIMAIAGHFMGLVIPKRWTDAIGFHQHQYHLLALGGGLVAAAMIIVGLFMLILRRRTTGEVFNATTVNDKVMYIFLTGAVLLGTAATLFGTRGAGGTEHNYRETVSIWFRSLFTFQPDVQAMAAATPVFKAHVIIALLLFAIWPFTRLVHAFSAPLKYLFRPYIVYRTRDGVPTPSSQGSGSRRGWDPIGTLDRNQRPR
ncbi:respiratory nitrate reductase gamma subunit [Luteococcus japonicus]|uniref:Nitrate reductase-like protein NarX n=1 Tax=Luteococcus japonicus TaxID=33984 RepID=A0A3N1ZX60_9ACTN|nr:respiratory nitrate reductase subunit gamma [Luteococcus japonicus]ROR55433.1 respiratory nitrate reductase gamma subunit [Luteococcus japonicus]